jgi:hypothetical protein
VLLAVLTPPDSIQLPTMALKSQGKNAELMTMTVAALIAALAPLRQGKYHVDQVKSSHITVLNASQGKRKEVRV